MLNRILIIIFLFFIFIINPLKAQENRRVAILDFTSENAPETYARSVRNLFEVSLYQTGDFDILERNKIESILKEQGFQMSGCTDTSCAVKIGQLLSANIVIIGSLNRISKYIIAVKFINIQEGKIDLADSETAGTEDDIQNAVKRLAERMAMNLKKDKKQTQIVKEPAKETKEADDTRATKLSTPYSISINGSYLLPQGSFKDLAQYGYGLNLIFNYQGVIINNLSFGIETGYWYLPGKKKNVDYCALLPGLATLGYRYDINQLFIEPVIGLGVSYNTMSYDKDGIATGEEAEFTEESRTELLARAGLYFGYNISDSIAVQIGINYNFIFEKDKNLYFLTANAGLRFMF